HLARQVNKGLHIFRKAESPVAQAGPEKLPADARVQTHGMRHLLDVRAKLFAKIGNDVGVADFECEKGIRGMLNQLCAADGGDEKLGFLTRRASSVVHRATETSLQNRPVDFLELGGFRGVL